MASELWWCLFAPVWFEWQWYQNHVTASFGFCLISVVIAATFCDWSVLDSFTHVMNELNTWSSFVCDCEVHGTVSFLLGLLWLYTSSSTVFSFVSSNTLPFTLQLASVKPGDWTAFSYYELVLRKSSLLFAIHTQIDSIHFSVVCVCACACARAHACVFSFVPCLCWPVPLMFLNKIVVYLCDVCVCVCTHRLMLVCC